MKAQIQTSDMSSLSASRLYDILKLRQDVFMGEQHIHYPDLDDVDRTAIHVFATVPAEEPEGTIASYARVYRDADSRHVKIGRVVTAPAFRGRGLASEVMAEAVDAARKQLGAGEVWIDAQAHAVSFYLRLGFETASGPFLEVGIPHVRMCLK